MHLLIAMAAVAVGLPDRGIFPDLDAMVSVGAPSGVDPQRAWLRVDRTHRIVTLYDGADPVKAWPAAIALSLDGRTDAKALALHAGTPGAAGAGEAGVALRADDLAELRPFVQDATPVLVAPPGKAEDHDGDGIVDRLDILIGAKKLLFNKARYIERYVSIKYPGGDVPRTEGVCSDTVIRALRNAGIDLQKEVHDDIVRAPKAYPMVEKIDTSINHRRVHTILPWFQRHFVTLPKGAPYLPGDIAFFDTFPQRDGPDHLGVVGERHAENGYPVVINNWTEGAVDAEMELLSWVPVTHHFRAPSPPAPRLK